MLTGVGKHGGVSGVDDKDQREYDVNRGVYRGPYLPIYGAGCVLLILLLRRLRRHPAAVFVLSCQKFTNFCK